MLADDNEPVRPAGYHQPPFKPGDKVRFKGLPGNDAFDHCIGEYVVSHTEPRARYLGDGLGWSWDPPDWFVMTKRNAAGIVVTFSCDYFEAA